MNDCNVDVVIPCAGNGIFFEQALDSVLAQICKINKIYIVDNCSGTDTYSKICNQKKSDLIVYIKVEERLSMTENWQYCLSLGSSNFFAFIHDDDIWDASYLKNSIDLLNKTNDTLCLSAFIFFTDKLNTKIFEIENKIANFQFLMNMPIEYRNFLISTTNMGHMSAMVFRRECISFPFDFRWMPDQCFLASYTTYKDVILLPKVNSYIRLSNHNLTHSIKSKGYTVVETIKHLRCVTDFYLRNRGLVASKLLVELDESYNTYLKRLKQACFSWPLNPILVRFGMDLIEGQMIRKNRKVPRLITKLKGLLWIVLCLGADIRYFLKDFNDR